MVEEINTNSPENSGRLFSVAQITMATFIGAPIAGCLLLARNYQVLGKAGAAWQALAAGIVSTIILLGISFVLPEKFPNIILPMAYCIGMRQLVQYLQGAALAEREARGMKGSWAIAAAVGIVSLILIFAVVFAAVMILMP